MDNRDFMDALKAAVSAVADGRIAEAEVSLQTDLTTGDRTVDVVVRNEIKPFSPMTVIREHEEARDR